jgi:hypothetical protein
MIATSSDTDLKTFARNRYHHGQLLTDQSFQLEQYYVKEKIWLGNRLITGYGVVCGLDVKLGDDRGSVYVTPGVAIDKWGREMIVPADTAPQPLPRGPQGEEGGGYGEKGGHGEKEGERRDDRHEQRPEPEDEFVQVLICFKECLSDPQPLAVSECGCEETCAAAVIRERYTVILKPGKAPEIPTHCRFPDVFNNDRVDYAALARWVTQECPRVKGDGCIPLANVRLPRGRGRCESGDIDISVRPIVYTNDLLFELICGLLNEWQPRPRSGKY